MDMSCTHISPLHSKRVVDPQIAQTLSYMLHGVMTYGTGKKAAIPGFCAGKTGTTQLDRDSWFIGYTTSLITGVWSGNDDNTSMDPKNGSPSVRLWHDFMVEASPQNNTVMPQEVPVESDQPHSGGLLDELIDSLFGG